MLEKNKDRVKNDFNDLLSVHFESEKVLKIVLSEKNHELAELVLPVCI